jgi:hypothetical protein
MLLAMSIQPVAQRGVENCIRIWVTYMHGESKPAGYPRRASGGVTNYTSLDLENVAAYENLDREIAEKTDAVIESLSPAERCAIHHKYLHAVYRFNRETLEAALARALQRLEIGLRARDVWLG